MFWDVVDDDEMALTTVHLVCAVGTVVLGVASEGLWDATLSVALELSSGAGVAVQLI